MGRGRGRPGPGKGEVVGNHTGKKESQDLLFHADVEFPLWILGACGRKGFKQRHVVNRVVFGEENTVGSVRRWIREKQDFKKKDICDFLNVRLKLSN